MKYLVLLLIVVAVLGWLRVQRRQNHSQNAAPHSPQDMLPCSHCGVHVPRQDAIAGQRGQYCCAQHQQQHEG